MHPTVVRQKADGVFRFCRQCKHLYFLDRDGRLMAEPVPVRTQHDVQRIIERQAAASLAAAAQPQPA